MRRFLPLTAPPTATVTALIATVVLIDLLIIGMNLWIMWRSFNDVSIQWDYFQKINSLLCLSFAAFYGSYRVFAFHPVFRRSYYDWLLTTPWSAQKTLPLGPVRLTGAELPFLGLAMLLTAGPERRVISGIPITFLATYSITLMVSLLLCRQRRVVYVMLVFLGVAIRLLVRANTEAYLLKSGETIAIEWVLLPLATVILAGTWGLKQSLATPEKWEVLPNMNAVNTAQAQSERAWDRSDYGWPFERLGPEPEDPHVRTKFVLAKALTRWDRLILALLAGWLFYSSFCETMNDRVIEFFVIANAGGMGVVPLLIGIIIWRFCPPLSWWGRVRRLHLIIPGYDRVFLWPLMMILAFTGWNTLLWYQVIERNAATTAILLTVIAWMLLETDVFLHHFQYTGHHSIRNKTLSDTKRISA